MVAVLKEEKNDDSKEEYCGKSLVSDLKGRIEAARAKIEGLETENKELAEGSFRKEASIKETEYTALADHHQRSRPLLQANRLQVHQNRSLSRQMSKVLH